MVDAMRKAYRNSPRKPIDDLLAEQRKWKRKLTIAQNKLEDVRRRIDNIMVDVATPKGEDREPPSTKAAV